jgi:hypothetical protein
VSDNIISNARKFLRSNIDSSRVNGNRKSSPVFLYLPLTSPHTPILPSVRFQKKSSLGGYGDYVMQTDDAVGQVIAELKSLGALDDSMVIFTSDNGFSRSAVYEKKNAFRFPHHPSGIFRGEKADIYEGGHRVPLVVQWPKLVAPATKNYDPVSLTDMFATFSDIVNDGGGFVRRALHGEDSFSLLPLLLQHPQSTGREAATILSSPPSLSVSPSVYERNNLVVHSYHGCFAIREKNYLLAFVGGSGGEHPPHCLFVCMRTYIDHHTHKHMYMPPSFILRVDEAEGRGG